MRTASTTPDLSALEALELGVAEPPGGRAAAWRAVWPKLAAAAAVLVAWQLVVWSGWRPTYVIPPPLIVLERFAADLSTEAFWSALWTTLRRAGVGYGLALSMGLIIGVLVSRFGTLRDAVGSLITGLQSMPSVAWFPFAILLFSLTESAILFVVILGAAPSIANGIISGLDHIPPLTLRAGRMLGAGGIGLYRHVILPAALPSIMAGLKQGWAFAWRSLMAGELLVIIGGQSSIGVRLQFAREFADAEELLASMIVVLLIGIGVDLLVFGPVERGIRDRRGLREAGA